MLEGEGAGMSNGQLYAMAGLPVLVTVLGSLTQPFRFTAVDGRPDRITKRLGQMDSRLLATESSMRSPYQKVGEHERKLNARH